MEYPQAPEQGPKTRINWTQSTMITLAAFVGCLAALAMLYFLYKSRLGDSVRRKMSMAEQLDQRINDLQEEYRSKLERRNVPMSGKQKMDPGTNETSHQENREDDQTQEREVGQETQESNKSRGRDGDKVPTVPAV